MKSRSFLLSFTIALLVIGAAAFARADRAAMVITQSPGEPPALSATTSTTEIFAVTGAPCMVEINGQCIIRANHIEVR